LPAKATSFGLFRLPLLGIVVLHEPFTFQTAIGAALVLDSVALAQGATVPF
jgi:drug/metabolite transporter (DMT)-like permease